MALAEMDGQRDESPRAMRSRTEGQASHLTCVRAALCMHLTSFHSFRHRAQNKMYCKMVWAMTFR